jgi:hypothetical protein
VLALLAVGALPIIALAADQRALDTGYDDDPARNPAMRRMFSSLAILLLSGLLVLIFTIGAYLLIRVGRSVARKQAREAKPTAYVDAWSHYRVSDEDVEAAMRDLKAEHNIDDLPPDDDAGASPGGGPRRPG